MKVQSQPSTFIQPLAIKAPDKETSGNSAASEPVDVVVTSSKQEKPPSDAGQFVKMGVGGLATLGIGIPAVYAGVLGGGIVGSMYGAGIGTAVAAVSSHGALNFISNAFHATGSGAQIGIIIGGASALLGAGAVGWGIGQSAGRVFGAGHEMPKPADLKETKGLVPEILAGVGALGGATGGAIIGAGMAAAGSIANGWMAQGVSGAFTNAPIAAAIGGAIGLAAGGYICGKGGVTLAKLTDKAGHGIKAGWDKLMGKTGDGETIEAKQERLNKLQGELKSEQVDLSGQTTAKRKDYNDDKSVIDNREAGVVAKETDVAQREKKIDDQIEAKGQAAFTERSQDLRDWKGRLDVREGQQNKQQSETQAREAQIDREITAESDKIFAQRRVALEGHYHDLQGDLDKKERGLNDKENWIHAEIERRFQADVTPKQQALNSQISDASYQEQQASSRMSQARSEASQAAGVRQQAEGDLHSAQRDRQSAESEVSSIINATGNLRSQLQELQGEKIQLDAKQRDIEARERK